MEYPLSTYTFQNGEREFILKQYSEQQARHHGAGGEDPHVVCAGPRFIRCATAREHHGRVKLISPEWAANYGHRKLPSILRRETTFGAHAEFITITVPRCKWLIQLANCTQDGLDQSFLNGSTLGQVGM